jgi:metal-sulfur cluster biosynthetic enzyme
MVKEIIQEVVKQYACEERDITVSGVFDSSVFLKMGPTCASCNSAADCRNQIVDKITQTFIWINQVNII